MHSLDLPGPSTLLVTALLLVALSAVACDAPQPQVVGPSPAPDNAMEARSTAAGAAVGSAPPEQATAGAGEDEVEVHQTGPMATPIGTPALPVVSLDEIRARAGVLYVPSYLPEGYVLTGGLFFEPLDHGRQVSLVYDRNFGDQSTCRFRLWQFPQGYGKPSDIRRFAWVEETIDTLLIYRQVMKKESFMFKRDTTWVHVRGGPCGLHQDVAGLDLAELVRIAKSMEPYEGGQEAVEGQGNETSEPSLITIKEVDPFEGEIDHEGQKGQKGGVLTRPATSLADAKEKAGFLYVPSYVPPGFELFTQRAGVGIASLTYVGRDTTIRIAQLNPNPPREGVWLAS